MGDALLTAGCGAAARPGAQVPNNDRADARTHMERRQCLAARSIFRAVRRLNAPEPSAAVLKSTFTPLHARAQHFA
eukprot:7311830-Alexandrium_andersonii.AAC.1